MSITLDRLGFIMPLQRPTTHLLSEVIIVACCGKLRSDRVWRDSCASFACGAGDDDIRAAGYDIDWTVGRGLVLATL